MEVAVEMEMAVVEKTKQRFTAKVRRAHELHAKLVHAKKRLEEKNKKNREERLRLLRQQQRPGANASVEHLSESD